MSEKEIKDFRKKIVTTLIGGILLMLVSGVVPLIANNYKLEEHEKKIQELTEKLESRPKSQEVDRQFDQILQRLEALEKKIDRILFMEAGKK